MLTKASIMNAKDQPLTSVDVPIWGGNIYLKPLTLKERSGFEKQYFETDGTYKDSTDVNMILELLALMITNDRGVTLFTPKELKMLESKNAGVMKELFEVALRVSYQTGFVKIKVPGKIDESVAVPGEPKEVVNEEAK